MLIVEIILVFLIFTLFFSAISIIGWTYFEISENGVKNLFKTKIGNKWY